MPLRAKTIAVNTGHDEQQTHIKYELLCPSERNGSPSTVSADMTVVITSDGVHHVELLFSELRSADLDTALKTLSRWALAANKELTKLSRKKKSAAKTLFVDIE